MTTRLTFRTTLMLGVFLCLDACGAAAAGPPSRSDGSGGRSATGAGSSTAPDTRATGGVSTAATSAGGSLSGGTSGANSSQPVTPGWLDANAAGSGSCSAEELGILERALRQSLDSWVAQCISSEFWVGGPSGRPWESRTTWQPPDPGVVSMVAACDANTGDLVDSFAADLTTALTNVAAPNCASSKVFTLHGLAEDEFAVLYREAVQCGPRVDQVRILVDSTGIVSEVRAIATTPTDTGPTEAADCLRLRLGDARFPCLGGQYLCLLRIIDGG